MFGVVAFAGFSLTGAIAANPQNLGADVHDRLLSAGGSAAAIVTVLVVCVATGFAARNRRAAVGPAVADVVLPGIGLGLVALEQNWVIVVVSAVVGALLGAAAANPHIATTAASGGAQPR